MIIGIAGPAKAGKDTVAAMIGWQTTSFANPLKEVTALTFDIPREDLETQEGKASKHPNGFGFTNRELLQMVGTDMFRKVIHNDVWTEKFKRTISSGGNWIVPDVRFDGEAQTILDAGGIILDVVPGYDGYEEIPGTHSSEAGINPDLVNYRIYNDSSIDDLQHRTWETCWALNIQFPSEFDEVLRTMNMDDPVMDGWVEALHETQDMA